MEIKDILAKAIEDAALSAIKEGVFPEAELPGIVLEVPPKKELGDFATNIAMQSAKAFRMNVLAYNRTPGKVKDVDYVALEELLEKSDIVSLHVPLTPETKGFIGEKELALMKPSAILINTARGPVADTKALADALQSGKIAGAGIDVFDAEPPLDPADPLLHTPHTVVTPHVAFATKESMIKRAIIEFDNIAAFIGERK